MCVCLPCIDKGPHAGKDTSSKSREKKDTGRCKREGVRREGGECEEMEGVRCVGEREEREVFY